MPDTTRPSTRRYLKGELTREQIVAAARKLFTERGYNNTSIYDLFEASGIGKGAFYHHWKTKEDLARTILDEMKAAYREKIFPLAESEGRARDQIERVFARIAELNQDPNWYCCRLMSTLLSELPDGEGELGKAVHAFRRTWQEFWRVLLRRAQEEGDLRSDLATNELSFLVVSTIYGVFVTGKNAQNDAHAALATLRRLLFT